MAVTRVVYKLTLYAGFNLPGDKKEALDLAEQLLRNERFCEERLIPALDDPMEWADALQACEIEVSGIMVDGDELEVEVDPSEYIGR